VTNITERRRRSLEAVASLGSLLAAGGDHVF
jgi:hypothetical protein